MLKFSGRLERGRFAWAAGIRVGLFVASVAALPLLLWWSLPQGADAPGVRGAGALVLAMAMKPAASVLFIASLIGIGMRRTRDIGLPGWMGLFVPLLFAGDFDFLTYFAAPWSLAFVMGGFLFPRFPYYALLGLVCLVVLATAPTRAARIDYGLAGRIAFAFGLCLAVMVAAEKLFWASMVLLSGLGVPSGPMTFVFLGLFLANMALPVLAAVFVGLVCWMLWSRPRVSPA